MGVLWSTGTMVFGAGNLHPNDLPNNLAQLT